LAGVPVLYSSMCKQELLSRTASRTLRAVNVFGIIHFSNNIKKRFLAARIEIMERTCRKSVQMKLY